MTQNQDPWEEKLGQALATIEIPTSTVAVTAVVRTGQARARRRHLARACAVALALLAAPGAVVGWGTVSGHRSTADAARTGGSSAAAGPSTARSSIVAAPLGPCRVSVLPLPSGVVPFDVTGADSSGRYIIGDTFDARHDSSPVSIRWDDGTPMVIPVGGTNSFSRAVNSSGVVVGTGESNNDPKSDFAWIYRDGRVSQLPLPSGYPNNVEPSSINAAGDVAGSAADPTYNDIVAVLWPADQPGTARVLPTPTLPGIFKRAQAVGVASDGSVIGTVGVAAHAVPYRWDRGGNGSLLALPTGATDGWVSAVRGWLVFGGVTMASAAPARDAMSAMTPARWDLRTGTVELLAPQTRGHAVDGNAAGDVIVDSAAAGDNIVVSGGHRTLLHAGQPVTLDPLTTASEPYPTAIADGGRALAGTDYVDPTNLAGHRTPVVWHC